MEFHPGSSPVLILKQNCSEKKKNKAPIIRYFYIFIEFLRGIISFLYEEYEIGANVITRGLNRMQKLTALII
jgi:hypothetical protein